MRRVYTYILRTSAKRQQHSTTSLMNSVDINSHSFRLNYFNYNNDNNNLLLFHIFLDRFYVLLCHRMWRCALWDCVVPYTSFLCLGVLVLSILIINSSSSFREQIGIGIYWIGTYCIYPYTINGTYVRLVIWKDVLMYIRYAYEHSND